MARVHLIVMHATKKKIMGNKVCIHCGVPMDYYRDESHWSRPSCRKSPSRHHTFALKIFQCCCWASVIEEDDDDYTSVSEGPVVVDMLR